MLRKKISRILRLLVLPSLVAACAIILPARGRGESGTWIRIEHDKLTRKALVHLPEGYRAGDALPLVLVFHGGGGNPEGMDSFTAWNKKADEIGAIVAYPQGTGRAILGKTFGVWNAGRCCGQAMIDRVDDVGFVSRLIDTLHERYNIDKGRVYATGYSNGAQLSYRLACELSSRITAIAPVGGQQGLAICEPRRAVPVMNFHGVEDPCSTYEGEKCGGCFSQLLRNVGLPAKVDGYFWCPAVQDVMQRWREINRCQGQPRVTFRREGATCLSYERCSAGSEVTFCSIDEMGHTWPGGTYGPSCERGGRMCDSFKKVVGPLSDAISATDEMAKFFLRHRL